MMQRRGFIGALLAGVAGLFGLSPRTPEPTAVKWGVAFDPATGTLRCYKDGELIRTVQPEQGTTYKPILFGTGGREKILLTETNREPA